MGKCVVTFKKKYNGSFYKTTTKEPYVCVYTHTQHINYTYIMHTVEKPKIVRTGQ